MANNDIARLSNLGHGVSTRLISWEQQVRDAEGSRWNLPIGKYFFGDANQYVFVEYDDAIQGPPMTAAPAPAPSPAPLLISVTGSFGSPSGNGASGLSTPTLFVNVVWNPPSAPAFEVDGYLVQRSTAATGPFFNIILVEAQAGQTQTYSDQAVSPNTNYYYQILGFNFDGSETPASNILGCLTPNVGGL